VNRLTRATSAFGRFWWDFLVGDTPELFVAVVVIVAMAQLLRHDRVAAVVLLPLLAIAMLIGSTFRGRRRTGRSGGLPPSE
jgi:hypothetical protein